MSESIPAWKQAIYDRKKQQQKEEELKYAEEEAYLSSLPPWKRSLFLKKKREAEEANAKSLQGTTKPTSRSTAKQQPQTVSAPAAQNKPSVPINVPAWKRKGSPVTTNDATPKQRQVKSSSPVNTNNNNSDSWIKKATPVSASVPTKETSTAAVNGTDNLPLWKRNLFQKQTAATAITTGHNKQELVSEVTANGLQTSSVPTLGKRQSDTSMQNYRPQSSSNSQGSSTLSSKSVISLDSKKDIASTSTSDNRPHSTSPDDYDDSHLASLPPWKRELILRKRAAGNKQTSPMAKLNRKGSMEKDSGWKVTVEKDQDVTDGKPHGSSVVRRMSGDKISMWEKKVEESKPVKRASQEIPADAVKLGSDTQRVQMESPTQEVNQPVTTQITNSSTELMNGPETEVSNESAPPILKDKDPWAHLSENDPQFKALPAWKQAMILRRRGDIRRRSSSEVDLKSLRKAAETAAEDETDFADMPAWRREALLKKPTEKVSDQETLPDFDDPDMPEWKKEKLRKSFQERKNSKSLPVLLNKKQQSSVLSETRIPEWKKEAMKEKQALDDDIPEWKKEAMKNKQATEKASIPEWKKEAMKAKKTVEKKDKSVPLLTSIRPLSPDKGNSSSSPVKQSSPQPAGGSDETDFHITNVVEDDDDDDIPCTNIDDLSDSDESVGGSGSYDVNPDPDTSARMWSTSSGYASDNNTNSCGMRPQVSSKSILISRKTSNPGQGRRRKVSWNDDQMHTEHTYPKYDYTDYDELNEEAENESKDDVVFSHPIHPSLGFSGSNRSSRNSDDLSSYKPNFLSSYTVTASSNKKNNAKKEEKTDPVAMPADEAEFNMSNLSDDVAALLF